MSEESSGGSQRHSQGNRYDFHLSDQHRFKGDRSYPGTRNRPLDASGVGRISQGTAWPLKASGAPILFRTAMPRLGAEPLKSLHLRSKLPCPQIPAIISMFNGRGLVRETTSVLGVLCERLELGGAVCMDRGPRRGKWGEPAPAPQRVHPPPPRPEPGPFHCLLFCLSVFLMLKNKENVSLL